MPKLPTGPGPVEGNPRLTREVSRCPIPSRSRRQVLGHSPAPEPKMPTSPRTTYMREVSLVLLVIALTTGAGGFPTVWDEDGPSGTMWERRVSPFRPLPSTARPPRLIYQTS
jgi:hypothetical protein